MAVVSTAIRTMLVNDIPRFLVNQYMYILYHSCMLYSHHLLGLPRMFVVSIIPNITDLINLSSCIRRPKNGFVFRTERTESLPFYHSFAKDHSTKFPVHDPTMDYNVFPH